MQAACGGLLPCLAVLSGRPADPPAEAMLGQAAYVDASAVQNSSCCLRAVQGQAALGSGHRVKKSNIRHKHHTSPLSAAPAAAAAGRGRGAAGRGRGLGRGAASSQAHRQPAAPQHSIYRQHGEVGRDDSNDSDYRTKRLDQEAAEEEDAAADHTMEQEYAAAGELDEDWDGDGDEGADTEDDSYDQGQQQQQKRQQQYAG